jgi:hypothetical protein
VGVPNGTTGAGFATCWILFPFQENIAARVNLSSADEAEAALVGMISDGEIFATINQLTGTVSFHDDPEQYITAATTQQLQQQTMEARDSSCANSASPVETFLILFDLSLQRLSLLI